MTGPESGVTSRRPRRGRLGCLTKLFVLAAALLLLALFFWRPALMGVARFLVVDEPPVESDVVVVAGGNVERITYAIDLVKRGVAPRILVIASTEDCPEFWGFSCSQVITARLAVLGLRKEQVLVETRPDSTRTDAVFSLQDMEREGFDSAVVVSDPFHMRRLSLTWRRVFASSDIRLTFKSVPFERTKFSLEGWWSRERELLFVFSEYVKLALYLAKGYI